MKKELRKFSHIHKWHSTTLDMKISILHLGKKTRRLKASGFKTVGDIVNSDKLNILKIDSIGVKFINKIQTSLDYLNESQNLADKIDWDKYCNLLQIPLLPQNLNEIDAYGFIKIIENTFHEINDVIEDPAVKKIIFDRINKPPKDRITLDQIGSSMLVPVTRERIRQKEAKFLNSIAGAFFDDDYSEINIHFRPEFTFFWQQAAKFFVNSDEEISINTLIDGLSETWRIDKKTLIENISIIVTVITGELMPASFFGGAISINPKLMDLSLDIKKIPLKKLQIGRAPYFLSRQGIETIGDFIANLEGSRAYHSSKCYKDTIKHLDLLSNAIDENKHLNWSKYIQLTSVTTLPKNDTENPQEFFKYLSLNISELLRLTYNKKYILENYTQRTSRSLKTRVSSLKLAKLLNTHQPLISKIEKETLIYLNRIILQADHSFAGVEISKNFSQMWAKMGEVFDISEGDAELLEINLAKEFKIEIIDLKSAMPTIYGVFTGHSLGRLSKYNRLSVNEVIQESDEPLQLENIENLPMRVKLKGFKRLH